MVDLNCLHMTGHLVGDTEIRDTKSGKKITVFSIAVGDDYKFESSWIDRSYFFSVNYIGEKKLEKGTPVLIEGKLVQVKPKEKKEGMPSSYIKIQAWKLIAYPKKIERPNSEYVVDEFPSSTEDLLF